MRIGELFTEHGAELLRCAKRVTGSDADAEEAVAEAFLALVRSPRMLDPRRDPRPYLRRAVLNRALNQLRRRKRSPGPLPEALAAPESRRGDLADRLRRGLARLTPRQAEVFVLRHVEGASSDEIAAELELSPSTVRVHLHQAVRALRALFENEEVNRV